MTVRSSAALPVIAGASRAPRSGPPLTLHERRRSLIELAYDPLTRRRLLALGLGEGWRCLEVGAGGGSIARWMAGQVGPLGHVLATDICVGALAGGPPNLEVRRHDILLDDLPAEGFDLVHARLLLMGLAQREHALGRLMTALKPGGRLLTEDHDWFGTQSSSSPAYQRAWAAMVVRFEAAGIDPGWARRVPMLLQRDGLVDVGAEADSPLFNGRSPLAELCRLTWRASQPWADEAGDEGEAHEELAVALDDPQAWFVAPSSVGAWGTRPRIGPTTVSSGKLPAG